MDPMQEEERLVLEKRLRKAVREDLTTKGYVYSERGDVDLLIYIEAKQTTRINIQQGTAGYTTYSGRDTSGARSSQYYLPTSATVDASSYDEGTLMIELIDARSKSLVWRGTGEGALAPGGGSQEDVAKTVSTIMENYPPSD